MPLIELNILLSWCKVSIHQFTIHQYRHTQVVNSNISVIHIYSDSHEDLVHFLELLIYLAQLPFVDLEPLVFLCVTYLPWLSCVDLEPLVFLCITYLPWLSCVNLEPLVFLCVTYLPWLSCVNLEPLHFFVTYLPWLSCVNLEPLHFFVLMITVYVLFVFLFFPLL